VGSEFEYHAARSTLKGPIRLTDLQGISKDPEPVTFVRRVLQTLAPAASAGVSQIDERWFLLARQTRNGLYDGSLHKLGNMLSSAVKTELSQMKIETTPFLSLGYAISHSGINK
jgi:hypothetical protein